MEYYGRRNRRGRPRSRALNPPTPVHFVQRPPTCSVYNGFCNFLLMSSLVAIIFIMLNYHCIICNKKCDFFNITKDIDNIANNITRLKESYTHLEITLNKFSQDIPKIEGQIEILETLANTMEKGDYVWNPKTHLTLPNVDVFLKESNRKNTGKSETMNNVTRKTTKLTAHSEI